MHVENPIEKAGEMAVLMSPNAWNAWNNIAEDFKPVIEQMFTTLLSKFPEKGLGWRGFDDLDYYLERIKEEIAEFEENPSVKEAADIANFGMMLVYTLLNRKGG
jgi:hypothetical protein